MVRKLKLLEQQPDVVGNYVGAFEKEPRLFQAWLFESLAGWMDLLG